MIANPDDEYVAHARRTIKPIVADCAPYLTQTCKIVGASSDAPLFARCEAPMRKAVRSDAISVRSETYYLEVTLPGYEKGTFVMATARRLGVSTERLPTIATCRTICQCSRQRHVLPDGELNVDGDYRSYVATCSSMHAIASARYQLSCCQM
ncbi:hypothetical protein ACF1BQ_029510 [Bradyrhizobium sp. RDT10]